MTSILEQLTKSRIDWEKTSENEYIFRATFRAKEVLLRLNDFPDQPLCTAIIDDQETYLEEFPKSWTLPRHRSK